MRWNPTPPPAGEWTRWIEWANAVPSAAQIGLVCEQLGPGHATLKLEHSPWAPNPNGAVNGGLVCAAADQAMGVVALTALPRGALPATATLHAEFLRPALAPLTFEAVVTQRGRRLVFVSVDVKDAQGRTCVRVSGSMAAQSAAAHMAAAARA
jgi:uncharacterized protein (TIGR00369 family)